MANLIRPYMNADGFYSAIRNVQSDVAQLHKLLSDLNDAARMVGGTMPVEPFTCNIEGITPLEKSLTDAAFIRQMRKISVKNRSLLDKMLAYGKVVKQLKLGIEGAENKLNKLKERMRNQPAGAEHDTAKRMVASFEESLVVIQSRLKIALSRTLETRKHLLSKVVRITSAVLELFPDGDPVLREVFNKQSTTSLVESMVLMDDKMRSGLKTDDRKTVKI